MGNSALMKLRKQLVLRLKLQLLTLSHRPVRELSRRGPRVRSPVGLDGLNSVAANLPTCC